MMARYVLHVQKAIRVVSPISTALFVALNTEGLEICVSTALIIAM